MAAVEARLESDHMTGMGRIEREAEEVAYVICLDSNTQFNIHIKVL